MHYKWPSFRVYPFLALSFVGMAGKLGIYATEQRMSGQEWWADLPWLWLTGIFFAFWLGQIFNDAFNEDSWLQHNWRVFRSLGDFHPVEYRVQFHPKHDDENDKAHFIEIGVPFTFDGNAGSDVQIRVSYDALTFTEGVPSHYSWRVPVLESPLKGDRKVIPIALVADEPGVHGFTGDRKLRLLGTGRAYRINVEIFDRRHQQAKRLFIKIPNRGERTSVNKNSYYGSWFFLIDEEHLPGAESK